MTTLQDMYAETPDVRTVAARLGISLGAARKRLIRAGIVEVIPADPYTPEEMARRQILSDEGMPATWIAEDLGRPVGYMRKVFPTDAVAYREWKSVWGYIMQHPTLLALHEEFKPRRGQGSAYSRAHVESTRYESGDDELGADAA